MGVNIAYSYVGSTFNDEASSIIVFPGCSCTFWENQNFGGPSVNFEGVPIEDDLQNLANDNFNDVISSAECIYVGGGG
jgi:hypothetical protein